MKTIKIIDLLNKIANGKEDIPKKIRYGLNKWVYDKDCNDYFKKGDDSSISFQMTYVSNPKWLNIDVEILDSEDEFEDIDELPISELYLTESQQSSIVDTINGLIKNQKKIIERIKNNV